MIYKIILLMFIVLIKVSFLQSQWYKTLPDSLSPISTIACENDKLFVSSDKGLFLSRDYGASWTKMHDSLIFSSLLINANDLIAASPEYWLSNSLYKSTNDGITWKKVLDDKGDSHLASDGMFIYCGKAIDGPYRSSDGGDTWIQLGGVIGDWTTALHSSGPNVIISTILPVQGPELVTYKGILLYSTNNGNNWDYANTGASDFKANYLYTTATKLFAKTYDGVFVSENNGINWERIEPGINISTIASYGNNIFAGTSDEGVFISSDSGATWKTINTDLPIVNIHFMYVSGYNLIVSDGNSGIWRCSLSQILNTTTNNNTAPSINFISENFPNPFNLSTNLRYGISERSQVMITVFNSLAQKIHQSVNEIKEAGFYEQSFDASNLSSGIYFYRIVVTSTQNPGKLYVETKKMVLMK